MKNLLTKASNWKFIVPAFICSGICIYLFQTYQAEMSSIANEEVQMLDMQSGYAEPEISDFLGKLGADGRQIHRKATGVVDMIFPICNGLFLILLSAFFLKKISPPDSSWIYLALIPVALIIVDYLENFSILGLLSAYPDLTEEMVNRTSQLTSLKTTFVNISMSLPIVLAVIWGIKTLLKKK